MNRYSEVMYQYLTTDFCLVYLMSSFFPSSKHSSVHDYDNNVALNYHVLYRIKHVDRITMHDPWNVVC